jgi:hypothetical protein
MLPKRLCSAFTLFCVGWAIASTVSLAAPVESGGGDAGGLEPDSIPPRKPGQSYRAYRERVDALRSGEVQLPNWMERRRLEESRKEFWGRMYEKVGRLQGEAYRRFEECVRDKVRVLKAVPLVASIGARRKAVLGAFSSVSLVRPLLPCFISFA